MALPFCFRDFSRVHETIVVANEKAQKVLRLFSFVQ
jgi:hypothetical protein